MRTVGVLGGMGPEATIYFMQKVACAVSARDDADHVPLLVDSNSQVPSRINAILEQGGESPAPVLEKMAQRLQTAGAQALVMPCNTAHHYAHQFARSVNVPFLDMVELACAEAARIAPGGKIGVLGSPALQQVGVYGRVLAEAGLTPLYAKEPGRVLATIRSIKAHGPSDDATHRLNVAAAEMVAGGANTICICCTEFSLLASEIVAKVPVFDALDVLVSATVRFSKSGDTSSGLFERDAEMRQASSF